MPGRFSVGTSKEREFNSVEGTKVIWTLCVVDDGKTLKCLAKSVVSTA
jgi:hypothetical protein